MPELPEVETTLCGIKPHINQKKVVDVLIRHPRLRWPIPKNLKKEIIGEVLRNVTRRAKYLLLSFDTGTLILHLGMSGRLRILDANEPANKHDHLDIVFSNKKCLRFTDPRRFGAALWTDEDPMQHPLLIDIGPEPLESDFDGTYLFNLAQKRKTPIKSFIMDSKIVAGVGNIYATEALFQAHIHPETPAGAVTRAQFNKLVAAIKSILASAIKKGGTTLKDFTRSDGSPGYFSIELKAYGRAGEPCVRCKTPLTLIKLGQRSTVYCPKCQKR